MALSIAAEDPRTPGPGVGYAHYFEEALDCAVFSPSAVEHDEGGLDLLFLQPVNKTIPGIDRNCRVSQPHEAVEYGLPAF